MLLQALRLYKTFSKRTVVNGISINVNRSEVVGLLGPNGAGKTTTFRMIIGITRPDSGKIIFSGQDVSTLPVYKRARLGMGFLPQEYSIFQRLTVRENLLAIMQICAKDKNHKKKVDELLAEYQLGRVAKQKAYTLSGGEKRRLEIARSLISSPGIILLDEPFTGIDPITVGELQQLIKGLKNKQIGILVTDHNVRETLAVTDRSYIIDNGRVLAEGTPQQIVNNPSVKEHYLGSSFKL